MATKRGKQALDVLHYVTAVGWIGVALCQLTLNVVALSTADLPLMRATHEIAHIFDRYVLIALGLGALLTGLLLGAKTKWGWTRYWWVAVKLVLTLLLLAFAPLFLAEWIIRAQELSATPDAEYTALRVRLLAGSAGMVATLVLITVVSVTKPWGRRPPRPATVRRG